MKKPAFLFIRADSPLAELYRPHCPRRAPGDHPVIVCKELDLLGRYAVARVSWSNQYIDQVIHIPHEHILQVVEGAPGEGPQIGFLQDDKA
jgi:hypothetical protein